MSAEHVLIRNQTFFYKQKAPFIVSGMSVLGALEYDSAEDKVKCHECGEWFYALCGRHLRNHGLSHRSYKFKHGLSLRTALCGERLRETKIRKSHGWPAMKDPNIRAVAVRKALATKKEIRPIMYEQRNINGSCQAQILQAIRTKTAMLGRRPTTKELHGMGIHLPSSYLVLNVSSLDALFSLADLAEFPSHGGRTGVRNYTKAILIELIRDHYVKFRRVIKRSDCRRGILPQPAIFRKFFGSLGKAYEASGFNVVYKSEVKRVQTVGPQRSMSREIVASELLSVEMVQG